jgi:hypothetical protein
MHQVNARHEIIREWRSLPKELRQTDEQAAAFAMQIKDKYKFSSDSADHYQTVKDWLLRYLSITRGLARNAEDEGKMNIDAKSTDPPSRLPSGKLSEAARQEKRSRSMKALRRHFMKTGSACGGSVSGGRKRQDRCSIRPQSFRTTPSSRTSDLLPGSGMHSMSGA